MNNHQNIIIIKYHHRYEVMSRKILLLLFQIGLTTSYSTLLTTAVIITAAKLAWVIWIILMIMVTLHWGWPFWPLIILMILIVRIVCQGMVAKIHGILGKRQQKDRRILMVIIFILMTMAIKILTPLGWKHSRAWGRQDIGWPRHQCRDLHTTDWSSLSAIWRTGV